MFPLVAVAPQLLRPELRQVVVVEGEHEPHVRVVEAADNGGVVVVVRHIERVLGPAADDDVLTKGEPLEFRRDPVARDSVRFEDGHDVQKQDLGHRLGREIRFSADAADFGGAGQVDEVASPWR